MHGAIPTLPQYIFIAWCLVKQVFMCILTKFYTENLNGKDIGIKHLGEVGCMSIDWIELAQNMVQWWAFVNTVMNL
jgi:hypothetical protein